MRGVEIERAAGGSKASDERRLGVVVVHYGSDALLERCLESVVAQSVEAHAVVVVDHEPRHGAAEREAAGRLRERFPASQWISRENSGFAGGANAGIRALESSSDYILLLNPDVELDPTYAERLVAALEADPRRAIAMGKLTRPDERTLDSAGLVLPRHRRPRERGAGEPDRGQFDRAEPVDAASGAAMLLRAEALLGLGLEGELFDEDFALYYEDTDLCWRARLMGHVVWYEPAATALHGRGWQAGGRSGVPVEIRRHSFKNHTLQIAKNERLRDLLWNLPILLAWEGVRFGFACLRDPAMLGAYPTILRLLPRALAKRRIVQARADAVARNAAS